MITDQCSAETDRLFRRLIIFIGFTKSVYAYFDLRNYFKILLSRRVACFDLRKFLEYFCPEGFV